MTAGAEGVIYLFSLSLVGGELSQGELCCRVLLLGKCTQGETDP